MYSRCVGGVSRLVFVCVLCLRIETPLIFLRGLPCAAPRRGGPRGTVSGPHCAASRRAARHFETHVAKKEFLLPSEPSAACSVRHTILYAIPIDIQYEALRISVPAFPQQRKKDVDSVTGRRNWSV